MWLMIRALLNVYIRVDSIDIVDDPLQESSTLILVENIPTPYVITSNISNKLVQSNTHTTNEIHVHKESTYNIQDDLVVPIASSL